MILPDAHLWQMRTDSRKSLAEFIRKRLARQIAGHGARAEEVEEVEHIFDPDTLTLGFARRFATYKRPNLLLHDPDRLLAILTNRVRPVQLVIAGKAHPQDAQGQEMLRQWIEFIRHTPARSQAVFLSDYDMRLSEHLVQGVDVWLNTPRRPWEACGTSGMKVLVNGALNLSELDGWWAEAYTPDVGWALGDGGEHGEDPNWDAAEAEQLYTLLEQQVIPEFYNRDETGVPLAWIHRMRESMARLTPAFSATRCVREYTDKHYVPLAAAYRRRSLLHAERAVAGARAALQGVDEVLHIGRSVYADPYLVTAIQSIRLSLFPSLKVKLWSNFSHELARMVAAGKLDLALVLAIPDTPALSFLSVAEAPVYIALPKSEAIARSAKLNLDDLRAHDWILPAPHVNPYISEMIQAAASAKGIVAPDTHFFTAADEAFALVLAHRGAAFLTRESAWRISRDEIAIRPLAEERLKLLTRLAMRSDDKKRVTSEFVRAAGRKLVKVQHPQLQSTALAC